MDAEHSAGGSLPGLAGGASPSPRVPAAGLRTGLACGWAPPPLSTYLQEELLQTHLHAAEEARSVCTTNPHRASTGRTLHLAGFAAKVHGRGFIKKKTQNKQQQQQKKPPPKKQNQPGSGSVLHGTLRGTPQPASVPQVDFSSSQWDLDPCLNVSGTDGRDPAAPRRQKNPPRRAETSFYCCKTSSLSEAGERAQGWS